MTEEAAARPAPGPARRWGGAAKAGVREALDWGLVAAFALLALLPLIDFAGRPLGNFHIPGNASYVQQLTFLLTFLGGLVAALAAQHLKLSAATALPEGPVRRIGAFAAQAAPAIVCGVLAYAASRVVLDVKEQGTQLLFGLPLWVSESAMPLALAAMALVYLWRSSSRWSGRGVALLLVAATFALGAAQPPSLVVWLLAALLLAATLLGAPVFAAMSGFALLLFWKDGTPVAAVSAEINRLIESPSLPAIPLLTATGFILAETKAAQRLVRFFRAIFGFMPGGVAVLVAAVCALFTAFTGGSGVTIIALGGLVYPILREDGYSEKFSLGLVTAAGSLGLLFPPSLPVILYSVVAQVPANKLFLAGLLPGLVLVLLVAVYGVLVGRKIQGTRRPFSLKEALAATWEAKWELSIPVVMIALFASGKASVLETAAAAAAYTAVIACFIHKDLDLARGLPKALLKAAAMVGAVLLLLSCAMGLTGYLVDAQIPDALLKGVQAHIQSPVVFLLALNVVLLVLGSVLEIFSAIVVLTPLVVPLGAAYGVDPVHLGIIFLANLELGFLFPPVGLNLFLSSQRFGQPMAKLYRAVLPFLLILALGVLLITYAPSLSLAFGN